MTEKNIITVLTVGALAWLLWEHWRGSRWFKAQSGKGGAIINTTGIRG